MSEQLRLEQALGERPAVEREERAFGARRALVNVAGDDLLPGSRFAPDQHRALRRRHLLGQSQHILKQPRLAERLHEPGALAAPDLLLELLVLRLEATDLGRAPAQGHDLVVGERLRHVVERALVHRLDRGLQRSLRRHQDDRRFGVLLLRGREDFDPGDAGHLDVGEDEVGGGGLELLEPRFAALRRRYVEALVLEQDAQGVEDPLLVVDDENGGLRGHAASSLRRAAGK